MRIADRNAHQSSHPLFTLASSVQQLTLSEFSTNSAAMPSLYVLTAFAALALFLRPVLADPSPEASQIQANVEELTEKSADMQANAQGLAIFGQAAGPAALEVGSVS